MGREQELARAVVESYGQPHFPRAMQAMAEVVENPNARWHLLGQTGLKQAMIGHARELRGQGQQGLARDVLREVGIKFGNSTRSKQ